VGKGTGRLLLAALDDRSKERSWSNLNGCLAKPIQRMQDDIARVVQTIQMSICELRQKFGSEGASGELLSSGVRRKRPEGEEVATEEGVGKG
jgi:hypothetical protein